MDPQSDGKVLEDGLVVEPPQSLTAEGALQQSRDESGAEPWRKAPAVRRIMADVIDRLLPCPWLGYLFPPWLAVVVAYELLSDGLPGGRSVGKRLMGLRAVIVTTGKPCNVARSLLRNAGWTATRLCFASLWLAPLALTYSLIEVLLVLFSPSGQRLGDWLAGTQVTVDS